MARFSFEESKNYGNSGNSSFFGLKEDKDTAKVRFLLNDINDLYGVSCHEVTVNGRIVDVECLRTYDEPVDNCPLCAAGYQPIAKLYIPLYDEKSKESKIWTRGKAYFEKISGLCARYSPLVSTLFEIERHGKKGDTNTSYEIYPLKSDNSKITDFPEIVPENVAFKVKTFEELDKFVKTGILDESEVLDRSQQKQNTRAEREVPANTPIRRRPTYNEEDNY